MLLCIYKKRKYPTIDIPSKSFHYRVFEESLSECESVRVELVEKRLSSDAYVGGRSEKKNRGEQEPSRIESKEKRVAFATKKEIGAKRRSTRQTTATATKRKQKVRADQSES